MAPLDFERGLADDGKRNEVQRNEDGRFVFHAGGSIFYIDIYIYIFSLKGGVRGGKNQRALGVIGGLADDGKR